MHTVELLEEAVCLAEKLGYQVRQEWMAGSGGGGCEFMGRKWIFVDLALPPREQLEQVIETLRHDPGALGYPIHHELREMLKLRKSA